MIGFAAAVLGEIVTGKGALAQFSVETGVPLTDVDGIVLAIIAFNLIAAFLPASGKLVLPEDELESRPAGVLQDPKVSLLEPKKFFGFSGFGFTKANEVCPDSLLICVTRHVDGVPAHSICLQRQVLIDPPIECLDVIWHTFSQSVHFLQLFVGRLAQLGFASALLGEALTGKGPLAQIGLETGIPLNEAEPLLLFSILFTLFAAVNEGRGKFVDE
jgi:photosystem II 22kDa protein